MTDAPATSSAVVDAVRPGYEFEGAALEQVITSSVTKQFMLTAAREIARGLFGAARRR